jgi:hypothetical protein
MRCEAAAGCGVDNQQNLAPVFGQTDIVALAVLYGKIINCAHFSAPPVNRFSVLLSDCCSCLERAAFSSAVYLCIIQIYFIKCISSCQAFLNIIFEKVIALLLGHVPVFVQSVSFSVLTV